MLRLYYFERTDKDIKIHSRTNETFNKKPPDKYCAKGKEKIKVTDAFLELTGGKATQCEGGGSGRCM